MFWRAQNFNSDLNEWDTSSVTTMRSMFGEAHFFNGNISDWDVSAVTDMWHMFVACKAFNCDISSWDVTAVVDSEGMFWPSWDDQMLDKHKPLFPRVSDSSSSEGEEGEDDKSSVSEKKAVGMMIRWKHWWSGGENLNGKGTCLYHYVLSVY